MAMMKVRLINLPLWHRDIPLIHQRLKTLKRQEIKDQVMSHLEDFHLAQWDSYQVQNNLQAFYKHFYKSSKKEKDMCGTLNRW